MTLPPKFSLSMIPLKQECYDALVFTIYITHPAYYQPPWFSHTNGTRYTTKFNSYFCPLNSSKFKVCPQHFHQHLQSPRSSHSRRVLKQHKITAKMCMYWIFTLEAYWSASLSWMPPWGSLEKAESCRFTACVHHCTKS